MDNRDKLFRIAVRKFEPFESALAKQWDSFEQRQHQDSRWMPCRWTSIRCMNPCL